ncbi:MAG: hypothetical protein ACOVLE_15050, partial [Pirellula staleyi]
MNADIFALRDFLIGSCSAIPGPPFSDGGFATKDSGIVAGQPAGVALAWGLSSRGASSRGSRGAIHLGLSNKLGVALLATYCNR